jgi:hypothetical protein
MKKRIALLIVLLIALGAAVKSCSNASKDVETLSDKIEACEKELIGRINISHPVTIIKEVCDFHKRPMNDCNLTQEEVGEWVEDQIRSCLEGTTQK